MACLVKASDVGSVLRWTMEVKGANSYPNAPGTYPAEVAMAPVLTVVAPSNRIAPTQSPDSNRCSTPESRGYSNDGGPVGLFRTFARPTNPTFVTVIPTFPTEITACSNVVCAHTSVDKTAHKSANMIVDFNFKTGVVAKSMRASVGGRNG